MPANANNSLRENVNALNKDIEEAFIEAYGLEHKINTMSSLGALDEADEELEGYSQALIHLSNLQRERHQYEQQWVDVRIRSATDRLRSLRLEAKLH